MATAALVWQDPVFGRRRLQTQEHSELSGRIAAKNLVGQRFAATIALHLLPLRPLTPRWLSPRERYIALPSHSMAFPGLNLRLTSVGVLNSRFETYGFWLPSKETTGGLKNLKEGVVFYVHQGRVMGVLLWEKGPSGCFDASLPGTAARAAAVPAQALGSSVLQLPQRTEHAMVSARRLVRNTCKCPSMFCTRMRPRPRLMGCAA